MGYFIGIGGKGESCLRHEQLPLELTTPHCPLQSIQLPRLTNTHRIHHKPSL